MLASQEAYNLRAMMISECWLHKKPSNWEQRFSQNVGFTWSVQSESKDDLRMPASQEAFNLKATVVSECRLHKKPTVWEQWWPQNVGFTRSLHSESTSGVRISVLQKAITIKALVISECKLCYKASVPKALIASWIQNCWNSQERYAKSLHSLLKNVFLLVF